MGSFFHALRRISFFLIVLLSLALKSQSQGSNHRDSILIKQIIAVEAQFESELLTHGAAFAFEKFADADAVIKRQNDTLIRGAKEIGKFYSGDFFKTAKAYWKPDFVDISNDGTMAYTYGKYLWKSTGAEGKVTEHRGVFHTVWKRQKDGSWKYVWD